MPPSTFRLSMISFVLHIVNIMDDQQMSRRCSSRLLFLQTLYTLSDERVIQEAQVNLAYKWFLGLNPEDLLPDPSQLSKRGKTVIPGCRKKASEAGKEAATSPSAGERYGRW